MTLDQVVTWIVVGAIAGLLAHILIRGIRLGILGTIVIGILGAFIGGWLFSLLGISLGAGLLGHIVVAFVGAVVLLVLLRAIRRL